MNELVGILLAAGAGRRFGSDKLLHLLPTQVPIAVTAAKQLRAELPRCVAVVRPGSTVLTQALQDLQFEVVECIDADTGMGASLACAIKAAGAAKGYVVALADMPFIRRSSIAAVRDAVDAGAALSAPYFRARRGHPVGIAGQFEQALLQTRGDAGARALFETHAALIKKIPVGDPGVVRDIDTPADLSPRFSV